MPYTNTENVPCARLREELAVLGHETYGSRSDLVSRLQQSGIYEIDTNRRPNPPKLDRIIRYPNHSSILLGNAAIAQFETQEQFIVQNNLNRQPLIFGNFEKDTLNLSSVINVRNSADLCPTTPGIEGDIRRKDNKLYIYRTTNVYRGWYEIQIGSMLLA
jgi:hypothetical protein